MASHACSVNFVSRVLRKLRTVVVYTLAMHILHVLCDTLIPNAHWGNRLRGMLYSPFFKRCGRRFALASGCVINSAWNMEIGDDVYIAHNCWINAAGGLTIGNSCILSPGVVIATTAHARENGQVSLRKSNLAPVAIGDGTWIASMSVVTRGVTIGSGAVIGAGSVVIRSVQSNTLNAGNPLKFIKRLSL